MSQNCSRQEKKVGIPAFFCFSSDNLKSFQIFLQNRYDFYSKIVKIAWKYIGLPDTSQQVEYIEHGLLG